MVAIAVTRRDGSEETIQVGENETVLEAAEDRGIGLPYGCQHGACGTCTARLLEGEIEYNRPPRALKDRHRASGYVLTCIARPTSDCRLEVGAKLQAEMMRTPWK